MRRALNPVPMEIYRSAGLSVSDLRKKTAHVLVISAPPFGRAALTAGGQFAGCGLALRVAVERTAAEA